jgi:hypothetical protein
MNSKLFALAVLLTLSPLAMADTIVIQFSGTLFDYGNSPFPNPFAPEPGFAYTGQLVYTLPGVSEGNNLYSFSGASDGLTISAGSSYLFSSVGTTQASQQAEVDYQTNLYRLNGNDFFGFTSYTTYGHAGYDGGIGITLSLVGSAGFLQSSAMPTEINSADLLQGYGAMSTAISIQEDSDFGGVDTYWKGTVDSVQLTGTVPEPSTISLVALVLAGVGLAWRRVRGRLPIRQTPSCF